MDISSCGPTLDISDLPDTEVIADETDGGVDEETVEIWGRFFPLPRGGLTGIGKCDNMLQSWFDVRYNVIYS